MNEKFYDLSEEKQKRIINSALKIFAKNDYKHASTNDIAMQADISKGLLFYYFENKIKLYTYIYDYTMNYVYSRMVEDNIWQYTDFFELSYQSGLEKVVISKEYPYMFEFMMRAYMDTTPEVKSITTNTNNNMINDIYKEVMANVDYSKFKPEVDLKKLMNVIYWTGEGYLKNLTADEYMDFEKIRIEYNQYMEMFKHTFYKSS